MARSEKQMQMTERRGDGVIIVAVSGRLRDGTADTEEFDVRLGRIAEAALEDGSAIVVDCSGLEYINSIGERALMKVCKRARPAGIGFALASLQPLVSERLMISKLDTVIPVFPDVKAAVRGLHALGKRRSRRSR